MERRDFLKDTAAAAVALTLNFGDSSNMLGQPGRLALENDQLLWEFSLQDRKLSSVSLTNKLSGKRYPLQQSQELRLSFSGAQERVEIPWWRCTFGPDHDSTPPDRESGYLKGYQAAAFDDSGWDYCIDPCRPAVTENSHLPHNLDRPVIVYRGYGWFRTVFHLPAESRGQEVFLNLGGYDQTDWIDNWVYVNGVEVGRRTCNGRWRNPGQYRIAPTSPAYASLGFGSSSPNVLALRTHAYDRHFDNLSDEVLERYLFNVHAAPGSSFYDQFVTVGPPYRDVANFDVTAVRKEQSAQGSGLAVEMRNPETGVKVVLHYELEGYLRRKWAEVINQDSHPKLLLDVDLDRFETGGASADGGYGYPLTLDGQLFCAVEHPSGLNRGEGGAVSLVHFPGKQLHPGETWRSFASIVGVAPEGEAREQFLRYIESHTVRKKKFVAMYDSFGITAFTLGLNWALSEEQNLRTLDLLEEWQRKGVQFDYYSPDMSLDTTATADLKQFRHYSFPDGPDAMIERIHQLGMKYSHYFSVGVGAWANWRNPKTVPSRIASPTTPAHPLYQNGYLVGGTGELCVASEPYFTMLKEAITYHCQKNAAAVFKFDGGRYYCTSTQHDHLPGKYSIEQCYRRLIELADTARGITPDVMIAWWWGVYSPFFALHGDVIQDARLAMEAACTCDIPALVFRDSVTQALDQCAWFTKWVPPRNHDTLGTWLPDDSWGNNMATEGWQNAAVMELGRGSLLFPQLWGDIYLLGAPDVEFLARIQRVALGNEEVFLQRRSMIGDAWKDAIYGYSYFNGEHGFVFLNNVSFSSRTIRLELGAPIGLMADHGQKLWLRLHFPEEVILTRQGNPDFAAGEFVEIQLRPFEVMMIEMQPPQATDPGAKAREAIEKTPIYSYRVPMRSAPYSEDLEIHFADLAELQKRGCEKKVAVWDGQLPAYRDGRYCLAVVCTFSKEGRRWRQSQMTQFAQATAVIGGTVVEFACTPDFRQQGSYQWNSWLVFSTPLATAFAGKPMQLGITSYLPQGVEMEVEVRGIKRWWRQRTRPLPNYWI